MAKSNLGELVETAKGTDRSLRQYATDSGVDVAIISRIINGLYIPKEKSSIYEKLTSKEANPRGKITTQMLIDASRRDYEAKAKDALKKIATMSATMVSPTTMMLGKSMIEALKVRKEAEGRVCKFIKIANAILYECLSEKEIDFQVKKEREEKSSPFLSTRLQVDTEDFSEIIFRYIYCGDYKNNEEQVWNKFMAHVADLVFTSPNKKRKVSIITNCPELYNRIVSVKNKISYKGYLSIVLIDTNDLNVVNEEYLSYYYDKKSLPELVFI